MQALLYKKYSTNSDVWSYGMVLFEIWSVGKKPFSQFTNSEVVRQVNTGYNQPPPPGCPRAIYQLMVDCWYANSKYWKFEILRDSIL
jgi:ephrin-B